MNEQINYLVLSYNERESQYVFKQTIKLLENEIIKVDYLKKTVVFPNFTIRFCTEYDYERLCLHTLRAKELGGGWFESQLDNYEKKKKNKEKRNMTDEEAINNLELYVKDGVWWGKEVEPHTAMDIMDRLRKENDKLKVENEKKDKYIDYLQRKLKAANVTYRGYV